MVLWPTCYHYLSTIFICPLLQFFLYCIMICTYMYNLFLMFIFSTGLLINLWYFTCLLFDVYYLRCLCVFFEKEFFQACMNNHYWSSPLLLFFYLNICTLRYTLEYFNYINCTLPSFCWQREFHVMYFILVLNFIYKDLQLSLRQYIGHCN